MKNYLCAVCLIVCASGCQIISGLDDVDPDDYAKGAAGSGDNGDCTPPSRAGGERCDPVAQCGCAGSESCIFLDQGSQALLTCVDEGSTQPYEPCNASDACTKGYQCIAGACKRSCGGLDASCDAGPGTCYQFNDPRGAAVVGGYICSRTCDVTDPQHEDSKFQACGDGLTCIAQNANGEIFTDCVASPTTAVTEGRACTAPSDCAAGLICYQQECQRWCKVGVDECASDEQCEPLITSQGVDFGVCTADDVEACKSLSGVGDCNVLSQCGCDTGERCGLVDNEDGETGCTDAGTTKAYAACSASTDCAAGATCVSGVCAAFCDGSSTVETPCGDDTFALCDAIVTGADDAAVPGAFYCTHTCNPLDAEDDTGPYALCGSGTKCLPQPGGHSDCFPTQLATATPGAACADAAGMPDDELCGPGYFCYFDALLCAQLCDLDASSSSCTGGFCTPFPSRLFAADVEIGYCSTAATP